MKRLSHIIGVAALVLMATGSPAMATHGQPDRMVPIKGSVLALDNGQVFGTPEQLGCPDWAEWRFNSSGTGRMSHLGRAELFLTHCSRYLVAPVLGEGIGTTTFTAANGDTFVLGHTVTFEVYFNEIPAPDGFAGSGSWSVVDGSGRFANATGSGRMTVLGDVPTDDTPMFDLPPGGTLWTFTGEVAYDASNQSL